MAELFLDGRQAEPPAERDMTEQFNGLQQEGQSRQPLSLQSTPLSTPAHILPYQSLDHPDRHIGQDAMSFCSSAPAHMMSHLPAIRTSIPVPLPKQEAADSRSTLSEADTFEPGSFPATAHSSPMTPPYQVQPAFPSTPPPAPLKQPRSQQFPPGCRETAAELLAHPSAKRSLQPAFDAAAVQAGLPLYDLQPFKPLPLDDAELGLPTPNFTGSQHNNWQRRQRRNREGMDNGCLDSSDPDSSPPHH